MENDGWKPGDAEIPTPSGYSDAHNGLPPEANPPAAPGSVRPRKQKRAVIIALVSLFLVAILTASAVLIFADAGLAGNRGVSAAYQYLRGYARQNQRSMSRTQREILSRIAREAFEIGCSLKYTPAEGESGLPIRTIPVRVDVKYDLNDLGVKVNLMGVHVADAFLLGDEFVLNIGGNAGSAQIGLPVDADLTRPMTFPQRLLSFLPFLAKDRSETWMRLLETFARSVPDEYTDTYKANVYSLSAGKKLETRVVETQLDSEAILTVIENFADRLLEDDALCDEVQTMLDEITEYFDLDGLDFREAIERLYDIGESDIGGLSFGWQVYRRGGRYCGMQVTVEQEDQGSFSLQSEYEGNTSCFSYSFETPGMSMNAVSTTTADGDHTTTETQASGESEFLTFSMRQSGTMEFSREDADTYTAEFDSTAVTSYEYAEGYFGFDSLQNEQEVRIEGDTEFRFGRGLETLRGDSGWNDIYDMDWGTLEDALAGLETLGNMLENALGLM